MLAPSRNGGRARIMSHSGGSVLVISAARSDKSRVQCTPRWSSRSRGPAGGRRRISSRFAALSAIVTARTVASRVADGETPLPGTDESRIAFSRESDGIVPGNHPPGEAILLTRRRLLNTDGRPARSAAAALGAAIMVGALASAAVASAPGDPISLLAPAAPAPADAASAPVAAPLVTPVASPIRNRLEAAGELSIDGEKLRTALLRQFYGAHEFQPVWENHKAQADALLRAVARAGEHGLDPELFHAGALRKLGSLSPIDRDLLLSDAFLGYADALARGAVPIEARYDDEDLAPEPIDVAAVLTQTLDSADPSAMIEGLAPRSPAYLALRHALRSYRADDGETARAGAAAAAGSGEAKRRAIIVNLERLRWVPRQLPADRIWVNIPTARLELVRGNRPVFASRVVVGETDKQTPELQTSITSVLFNPSWYVPRSIVTQEILPKLARDPNYLARHHMVMRPNGGIQQLPGAGTALGRLKFEATNRFDVYLHDTPLKSLFKRDDRFESHGCVRVENPRELGALLLGESVEAIDNAIARTTTARRMLPKAIPTFLVYQTAFVDSAGAIAFAPDVYGRDDAIWRRLQRTPQAPVAQRGPSTERRS
jgi:murein L,D-transpeptidase YcbB/YkuD